MAYLLWLFILISYINYGLNQYSFHQASVLYLIKDAAEDKYLEN